MRVMPADILKCALAHRRRMLASEGGFTTIVALGVLTFTTLFVAAVFSAAQGDLRLTQHDLDAKRAYYAARGGLQDFLFRLNQNSNYWQGCPSQATRTVPGSSDPNLQYESHWVAANTTTTNTAAECLTTNPIGTMIDTPTGTFRMRFTGYSGGGPQRVSRSIVAGFRRGTPIDYLWYTTYETLDPNVYPRPWGGTDYNRCETLRRDGRPSFCSEINWITGDTINGPMYTHDQYRICGSPRFGRYPQDSIETTAPGPPSAPGLYRGSGSCPAFNQSTVLRGTLNEAAEEISPPSNNTGLLTDATRFGRVYTGVTTIALNGDRARVTNANLPFPGYEDVDVDVRPIIYVQNSACSASYTPFTVGNSYPRTGGCGNVYISGSYTSSLTIGAANDIIIDGNVCVINCGTPGPSGGAMLGLVANNFIRVKHGIRNHGPGQNDCGNGNDLATTLSNPRIDAAILALSHSFIVDNYNCGSSPGFLTVNGAIAQKFRGTVGTGAPTASTGYTKRYTYDDRLAVAQPPYMFNIADANWHVERETSCIRGNTDPTVGC